MVGHHPFVWCAKVGTRPYTLGANRRLRRKVEGRPICQSGTPVAPRQSDPPPHKGGVGFIILGTLFSVAPK